MPEKPNTVAENRKSGAATLRHVMSIRNQVELRNGEHHDDHDGTWLRTKRTPELLNDAEAHKHTTL